MPMHEKRQPKGLTRSECAFKPKKIADGLNERTHLESCLRKDSQKGLARKELIGPMDSEEKIENRKRQVTCMKRKPKRLSRKSLNEMVLGSKIALADSLEIKHQKKECNVT
jgi:hypothetical protein